MTPEVLLLKRSPANKNHNGFVHQDLNNHMDAVPGLPLPQALDIRRHMPKHPGKEIRKKNGNNHR
jgi:hypothetical protein